MLKIIQRVMSEGNVRHGAVGGDLGPHDALALLRAWLSSMGLEVDERKLITYLQDGELSHADLERRARRIHERELARVVNETVAEIDRTGGNVDLMRVARGVFDACVPAIPYAAAGAFLAREKLKLTRSDGDRPRVALVGDGLGAMHGVTHTIMRLRDRGVPGFEVEVIGTDPDVDRRLSSVAEIEVPFYRGMRLGVPSVPAIVDAVADGRYDLVHVVSPGPAGAGAWLLAQLLEVPLVGSYHTELAAYAGLRSGQADLEVLSAFALGKFYGACDRVLSPSPATDARLVQMGIAAERIGRWDRGVDVERFDPALRDESLLTGEFNVLYAGRLTKEKGVDLLAEAFASARTREPRLHLVLAGGGPEEGALRERVGEHATFLGWQYGADLARTYASADAFLFASQTDTFGQVLLEAQASGLPVVAVAEGGPASLIAHGESGLLAPADADQLAGALLSIVNAPLLAARLRRGGLQSVAERTWDASLAQLAAGYRTALDTLSGTSARSVA